MTLAMDIYIARTPAPKLASLQKVAQRNVTCQVIERESLASRSSSWRFDLRFLIMVLPIG
jgi:hypothetical protein